MKAWKFIFYISFLRLSICSCSLFFSFLSFFNSSCTSLTLAFYVLAVIGLSGIAGAFPLVDLNDCIQFLSSLVTMVDDFFEASFSLFSLSCLFSSSSVCIFCLSMLTSSPAEDPPTAQEEPLLAPPKPWDGRRLVIVVDGADG